MRRPALLASPCCFRSLFLVLIFVLFLLIGHHLGRTRPGTLRQVVKARVRRYLLTKVAVSGVTGVLVALLLAVLGVDLWLIFGVAAFVLNVIPSVGSMIATLLPLGLVQRVHRACSRGPAWPPREVGSGAPACPRGIVCRAL